MKQSLTYYITLLVIKLKGLKKDFSKDPIDYQKIRQEDIHEPKGAFYKSQKAANPNDYQVTIAGTLITEIKKPAAQQLLLFVHGGAFISGPGRHHWDTAKTIAKNTNHTIWMCDYPKAPEHTISEISRNIDTVYSKALESYSADQITLMGDSVGGTLIMALVQRLVQTSSTVPRKLILLSPVMDATMSNPQITAIDSIDPMLSPVGVGSAKLLCAENNDLADVRLSPLNGSFEGFPTTLLYLATHDITYPDQQLAVEKLRAAAVDLEVIVGDSMPHIYPLLPVMKEAKTALQQIIHQINQ